MNFLVSILYGANTVKYHRLGAALTTRTINHISLTKIPAQSQKIYIILQ
jgi:hypothetical protein